MKIVTFYHVGSQTNNLEFKTDNGDVFVAFAQVGPGGNGDIKIYRGTYANCHHQIQENLPKVSFLKNFLEDFLKRNKENPFLGEDKTTASNFLFYFRNTDENGVSKYIRL